MFPNDFESEFTFENSAAVPLPDEPPFHILILGDWSGDSDKKSLDERRSIEIDRDNFDEVLKNISPTADLDLYGDENTILHIQFEELDDFHPDNLFRNIPLFSDLRDVRRRLSDSDTFEAAAQQVRAWFNSSSDDLDDTTIQSQIDDAPPLESNNILDLILDKPSASTSSLSLQTVDNSELGRFVSKLVSPHLIKIDETEQSKLLSTVDEAVSELMRAVLHHPKFQALESAWRALYFLVRRVETDSHLKIYILDVSHQELADNLKAVESLADSFLYRSLTSGSYSIVAGNYSYKLDVDDVAGLLRLSKLAHDFNTTFISHIKPEIFGVREFLEVSDVSDFNVVENSKESKLWQALRSAPESSHVGLSPMRVLGRLPYGEMTESIETFSFEEFDQDLNFKKFLWLNPCFLIVLLLAQSYKAAGSQMGKYLQHSIENMPLFIYRKDGQTKTLPSAEIVLTENLLEKILDQGVIPLVSFRDSSRIRIARYQSISKINRELSGSWF